ncbi:hypothetical protein HaLaN_16496, partial [Haematococcus lacustris]
MQRLICGPAAAAAAGAGWAGWHAYDQLRGEVIAYCKNYTKDGINAAASRPLLHFQHKQRYDELVRGLSALAIDATFALSVDQKTILLEKVNDKLNDGMPSM